MNNPFIVGIAAVAGAGKDTLCELLRKELYSLYGLNSERVGFGDKLKEECREVIFQETGIDILSCSREEKEKVRPRIVEYAENLRHGSKGTYWVNKADETIQSLDTDIVIISDARFADYPNAEHYYIKYYRNGLLIHLTQFRSLDGPDKLKYFSILGPPNEVEAEHDPKIKAEADICIQWKFGDKNPYLVKYLASQIYDRYLIHINK